MSIPISSKLKSLFTRETRVVFFTGAGISAESGVSTFRGKNGLWEKFRVEELATPTAFQSDPKRVWEWYNWRREQISKVKPNSGHHAVCEFEKYFKDFCLITQNVDGLHDKAGNRKILKLHGDIWEVRCVKCDTSKMDFTVPIQPLPPVCRCGAHLRPGVVWFEEPLPEAIFEEAARKSEKSQLFFSIGTSAEVYPAAHLPALAKQCGAYVVEVNITRSAAARFANEVLLGKSGEILPALLECLVDRRGA